MDIPIKLQKWQWGSNSRQLKCVTWKEMTMEAVTRRPMKSVITSPPRKIRKKDRERLCVRRKDLMRTINAIRLEVTPRVPKMIEKLAEAMVGW